MAAIPVTTLPKKMTRNLVMRERRMASGNKLLGRWMPTL